MYIICDFSIWEQLYCNNGHLEVVTSIHFVKIRTISYKTRQIRTQASRPSSDL